jgi:hypothetical protein
LFEIRRLNFELHFQRDKIGPNYSFKFPRLNGDTSIFEDYHTNLLKNARDLFKLKGWSHWNKNHPPNSGEAYVTRSERFKKENPKAGKILKNTEN